MDDDIGISGIECNLTFVPDRLSVQECEPEAWIESFDTIIDPGKPHPC